MRHVRAALDAPDGLFACRPRDARRVDDCSHGGEPESRKDDLMNHAVEIEPKPQERQDGENQPETNQQPQARP